MSTRAPGRPRSEEARLAILGAAVALVGEGGSALATMDAIARRAGVSKQTVYRWWSSPAEIMMEALNEGAAHIAPLEQSKATSSRTCGPSSGAACSVRASLSDGCSPH
jgi:AcrR family transcriptional regulator